MISKTKISRLVAFIGCLLCFSVTAYPTAASGNVLKYTFSDDGTTVTIAATGRLDVTTFNIFQENTNPTDQERIKIDDTQIWGIHSPSQPVLPINIYSGLPDFVTTGKDSYEGTPELDSLSNYDSDYHIRFSTWSERLQLDRDHLTGNIYQISDGVTTFTGKLYDTDTTIKQLGDNDFHIVNAIGSQKIIFTTQTSLTPSFGTATVADQSYMKDQAISELQLPAASGGDGTLTYSVIPALPAGLSFDATSRNITGTPTAAQTATEYTYSVIDTDGDIALLKFMITVVPQPRTLRFTFSDDGTTTTIAAAGSLDVSGFTFETDKKPQHDLYLHIDNTARWAIFPPNYNDPNIRLNRYKDLPDFVITGRGSYSGLDQIENLPKYSNEFNIRFETYFKWLEIDKASLTGNIYNPSGKKVTFTGTLLSTLTDNDFDIELAFGHQKIIYTTTPNKTPDFGVATVADQAYVKDEAISELLLPAATGGDGTLSYSISPALPTGLSFDAVSRKLTGTPTTDQAATEYTYTASDDEEDTATLTFKISVVPVPDKPSGLSAVANNGQVSLRWVNPRNSLITKYQYRQRAGNGNFGAWEDISGSDANTTSHTVTGLTNGTGYGFRIRAVISQVNGVESDVVTATPRLMQPAKPTRLYASVPATGSVDLHWVAVDASATSWEYRKRFEVRRGTDGTLVRQDDYENWTAVTNSTSTTRMVQVTGLETGVNLGSGEEGWYRFQVRGKNSQGVGSASDEVQARPVIETDLFGPGYSEQPQRFTIISGQHTTYIHPSIVNLHTTEANPSMTIRVEPVTITHTFKPQVDGWIPSHSADLHRQAHTFSGTHNGATTNPLAGTASVRAGGFQRGSVNFYFSWLVPPDAPTSVSVAAAGSGRALLSWGDLPSTTHEPIRNAISYWEYRSKESTATDYTADWKRVAGSSGATRSHLVTGLDDSKSYDFAVRAVIDAARIDNLIRPDDPTADIVLEGSAATTSESFTPGEGVAAVLVNIPSLAVTEGASATYTVSLGKQPTADVTITPSSSVAALASVSPSSLTFTSSNWATSQTVTVTGVVDDDGVGGTATVTHSLSSTDTDYAGLAASALPSVSVTVSDDDTPDLTLSVTSLTGLDEAGTQSRTYTVKPTTAPASTLTVTPLTGSSSVTLSPASLSFDSTNWQTAQTVTVTGAQDDDAVANDVLITHGLSGPAEYGSLDGTAYQVTAAVSDDDTAGITAPLPARFNLREGSSYGYSVALQTRPSAAVTLSVSSSNTNAVTGGSVTFTPGNWTTPQTLTITAVDDATATSAVLTRSLSGAAEYAALTLSSVTVDVIDNDSPGLVVFTNTLAMIEAGDDASYTVSLATQPTADVTLTVTSGDSTLAQVSSDTGSTKTFSGSADLTFTNSNWSSAQTVTVRSPVDGNSTDDSVTLSHTAVSTDSDYNAADFSAANVTVSITDVPAPAKPTDFKATPGNTEVTLGWSDPSNDTITKYQVRHKAGSSFDDTATDDALWTDITGSNADTTAYKLTGLTNGTQYVFQIRAMNAGGSGIASDAVTSAPQTPPPAPTDFAAKAGDAKVTLTWSDPSDSTITKYQVRHKQGESFDNTTADDDLWADIPQSDSETIEHIVMNLDNDTKYVFQIRAVRSGVAGAETAAATATPIAVPKKPSGLSTIVNYKQVKLSWNDPQDSSITKYQYKRSTGDGPYSSEWVDMTGSNAQTTEYLFTGLFNYNVYNFKIRAVNASGGGAESDVVTARPEEQEPAKPKRLQASVPATGIVDLHWVTVDASARSWEYRQRFEVRRSNGTLVRQENYGNWAAVTDSSVDTRSAQITGLETGTNLGSDEQGWYRFQVRGKFSDGRAGPASDEVEVRPIQIDETQLQGPGNTTQIQKFTIVSGQYTTYTYPSIINPNTTTSGARVTMLVRNKPSAVKETFEPQATEWMLGQSKEILRQVHTFCCTHHGDTANPLEVQGSLRLGQQLGNSVSFEFSWLAPPDAPTSLSVAAAGSGRALLSWGDLPSTTHEPIRNAISYWEYRSKESTATDYTADWKQVPGSTRTTRSHLVTGLLDSKSYDFSVRAVIDATRIENLIRPDDPTADLVLEGAAATTSASFTPGDGAAAVFATPSSLAVTEGSTTTYTVSLGKQPSANVTVTPSSSAAALASVSPSSLTFTASNWATSQTVTVTGVADDDGVGGLATVTHSLSSTDTDYAGLAASALPSVSVTVTDDDTPSLTLLPTSLTGLDEAGTQSRTYTVKPTTAPASTLTVTPLTGSSSVTLSPASLSFDSSNWQTAQTVTVTGAQDDDAVANDVLITHGLSGPAEYGSLDGTAYQVTAAVSDDDTPGIAAPLPTSFNLREGSEYEYSVVLQTRPSAAVTLSVSSDSNAVTANSVTFTPSNWATPQTLTITAVDDATSTEAKLTPSFTGAAEYASLTLSSVTVNVIDNDSAGLVVLTNALAMSEAGDDASYTVALATQPTANVTLTVTSGDSSLAQVSTDTGSTKTFSGSAVLTFTNSNWSSAQTVTVRSPIDDNSTDDNVTLTHTAASADTNYNSADFSAANVTVSITELPVPAKPTDLKASRGNTEVTLSWSDPSDSTITKYQVRHAKGTSVPVNMAWTDIIGSGASTTTHTVTGLINDTEYAFELRAVNNYGNSLAASTTEIPVAEPIPVPQDFTVTVEFQRDKNFDYKPFIRLAWTKAEGIVGGQFKRKKQVNSGWWVVSPWTALPELCFELEHPFWLESAEWSTTYEYEVRFVRNGVPGQSTGRIRVTTPDHPGPGLELAARTPPATDMRLYETGDGIRGLFESYRVRLITQPAGNVTVTVTSSDTSAATVLPSTVTFTPDNWRASSHIIFVFGVDDDVVTGTRPVELAHSISETNSPNDYPTTLELPSAHVRIVDDDVELELDLSSDDLTVDENGTATFDVKPSVEIPGSITLSVTSADPLAVTVSPAELTFTYADWETTQTVTVTGVDDVDAVQETTMVSLTSTEVSATVSVTVTDDDVVPGAPRNLRATAGDQQVTLTWIAASGPGITKYQVRHAKGTSVPSNTAWTDVANGANATTHTVTGLENGEQYAFEVSAVNSAGNGTAASTTATPVLPIPAAPNDLDVTAGNGQVTLTWTLPTNTSSIDKAQVRYKIQTDAGWNEWVQASTTTSHSLTGLVNGATYVFQVRLENAAGIGAAATKEVLLALTAPEAPTNFSATGGDTRATLSWTLPTNVNLISSIDVRHKLKTATEWSDWTILAANLTSYIVDGLVNGETYSFEVRAVNTAGEGIASAEATLALTKPGQPTDLSATSGINEADLSWTLPTNVNSITLVQVRHKVKSEPDTQWSAWTDLPSATAITHKVTGLVNGETYTFEVRVSNSVGDGDPASVDLMVELTVPGVVTGFAAVAGDTEADLGWTLPTNAKITSVEVRHKVKSAPDTQWSGWTALSLSANTHKVTGLFNGETYVFEVRARNSKGAADAVSAEATLAPTRPGKPTGLTAAEGDAKIVVNWKLPTNVNDLTAVQVRHKAASANWTNADSWVSLSSDATTYTVSTGLILGEEYTFQVRAVNAVGEGDAASINATVVEKNLLIQQSVEEILPNVAVIMGDQTVTGIRDRIQNYEMTTRAGGVRFNLTNDGLFSPGSWRAPVPVDEQRFLYDGQFATLVNSLGVSNNGRRAPSFSIWTGATIKRFNDSGGELQYDGELTGFSFGIDTRLGEDMVGGVTFSNYTTKTDYKRDSTSGHQKVEVNSVNPYFGLKSPEYSVWSFVGMGSGDLEVTQENVGGINTSDLSMNSMGVGASGAVWYGKRTTFHVTGEFTRTEMDVDGSDTIDAVKVGVMRSRMLIAASRRHEMIQGGYVEPKIEFGVAYDSGDGATGSRVEVGAGMHYLSPSHRMTMSLSSYGLMERNDYGEWGVQGSIRMLPGVRDRGLSFSLQPSYGATVRGVERIWETGKLAGEVADERQYQPRLDANLGYGFRIIGDRGLLTPYSEVSLEGEDRTYRVGTRFRYGARFELNLVGESADSIDDTGRSIKLQGGVRF